MPARRSRQEARERVLRTMVAALDRVIPPDEAEPLRGVTFADWERQAAEVRRAVIPVLLEERAALEEGARVERVGAAEGGGGVGRCPRCGSDRVYLKAGEREAEVLGPDGPVVLSLQGCRCRACGGTFSPSGAGLGFAVGGAADAGGGGAGGAGGGGEGVRPGGAGAEQ